MYPKCRPPSRNTLSSQRAATAEHAPAPAGDFGSLLFISPPLHRKFIPACLMSGDLWKRFFKAVRSCHKSRRYLRWNARQNISVNCYPVTSKSFAPFSETKKRPAPPAFFQHKRSAVQRQKSGLPLQGVGTLGASCAAYKGDEYNDASGSPVRSSFSLPMFFAFSISDSLT